MPPCPTTRSEPQAPRVAKRRRSPARLRWAAVCTSAAVAALSPTAAHANLQPPLFPASGDGPPQLNVFRAGQLELGSPSAPVTVVEYLSTTCSHCAAFERDTWPEVDRDYVQTGKVRFIIREMPTAPVAASAAGFLLARCAGPDRYWFVVQALLQRQDEVLSAPSLAVAIAREQAIAGLTSDAAQACLSDPVALDAINARRQSGLASGVDATPYFVINGVPLRPGARLGAGRYEGGELSIEQFRAAVSRAEHEPREALTRAAPRRGRGLTR